ncbi:MAG TPA: hypothetical protein VHM19_11120 [Polyangiales bacterium]|nr:hypothetical protein [Polyangiales bacterium]
MNQHAPIDGYDAGSLELYFKRNVKHSVTGDALRQAELLREPREAHKIDRRRREAEARQALLAAGVNPAALPHSVLDDEIFINETINTPAPKFEENYDDSARIAYVELQLTRMDRAHKMLERAALEVYFGPIGYSFANGYSDRDSKKYVPPLPRVWSLMHCTAAGVALLAAEAKLYEREQVNTRKRALLAAARAKAREEDGGKRRKNRKQLVAELPPEPVELERVPGMYDERYKVQGRALDEIGAIVGVKFVHRLSEPPTPPEPGLDLRDYERVRNLCFVREQARFRPLKRDFAAAELAAAQLYRAAADAWNAAQGGE